MTYDVVVVGGGIGGLTVASLLSARGVSVCLLERQSQVGGCVARVQFGEHEFEPGLGMYSGWDTGETFRKIFSELPIAAPEVSSIDSELVVRLADRTDVRLYKEDSQFCAELRRAFPECSESAVSFYQNIRAKVPRPEKRSLFAKAVRALQADKTDQRSVLEIVGTSSPRFKGFLDSQLRAFAGLGLEDAALVPASLALAYPRQNLYAIQGGPAMLAECLANSIVKSGSKVRLDCPVLRLAYDERGRAIGVDLLSGETVLAKHAIVSNLTVWDTYGKLVGLNRTPPDIKSKLSGLIGSGVYLLFASMEEAAISRLPSIHMLFAPGWPNSDENTAFSFSVSPEKDATDGKRSVTVTTQVDVNDWFRFQSSTDDLEEWDQAALETIWTKLHLALPELGADIEVIETANPRTVYDTTRRKLGMVLGRRQASNVNHLTSLPNVFMVGDTVSAAPTLASVGEAALDLVNTLSKP